MSITEEDDRVTTYQPVVATTDFPAGFDIFDNDDLTVLVDGVERTDFTVSATYVQGVSNDAKAVFNPGITGTVQVVGLRSPRRQSEFQAGAPIPPSQQNTALNLLQAQAQEVRRDIDRSLRVAIGASALPEGHFPKADANGNMVDGGDGADIANAQEYAAAAKTDADRAEAAVGVTVKKSGDTMTGTLKIEPEPGILEQGILVVQTGPTSGSGEGPFHFNKISSSFRAARVGGGLDGSGTSGVVTAFHADLTVGGPNFEADSVSAATFGLIQDQDDTSVGDKVALNMGIYSNRSTLGKLYGGSAAVTVDDGGSTPQLVGFEVDTYLLGSADTDYRIGVNSWNGGSGNGAVIDSAYGIGNRGGDIGGTAVAKWKQGFTLYTKGGATNKPMADDADLFFSDHAATLGNIFNFENVTVTGDILKFPLVQLSGDGGLSLGNNVTAGAIGLNGPADGAILHTFQQGGVSKWQFGVATDGDLIFSHVGTEGVPLRIDAGTNTVAIFANQTVSGTINGAVVDEKEWTDYTPVLNAETGAITTATAKGRYRRLFGRTVMAHVQATLTTVGTAADSLFFTLPVNADMTMPTPFSGKTSGTGIAGVTGAVSSAASAFCRLMDGGASVFTRGDGTIIDLILIYEADS